MNNIQVVYSGNKRAILGTVPKIGTVEVDGYKKPLSAKDLEQIEKSISVLYGYSDVHILNYFELGEELKND